MALFGQISSAGQGVGGAAHEPGAGIALSKIMTEHISNHVSCK